MSKEGAIGYYEVRAEQQLRVEDPRDVTRYVKGMSNTEAAEKIERWRVSKHWCLPYRTLQRTLAASQEVEAIVERPRYVGGDVERDTGHPVDSLSEKLQHYYDGKSSDEVVEDLRSHRHDCGACHTHFGPPKDPEQQARIEKMLNNIGKRK